MVDAMVGAMIEEPVIKIFRQQKVQYPDHSTRLPRYARMWKRVFDCGEGGGGARAEVHGRAVSCG